MGGRPLAGYAHLIRAAERLQWDDAALDLAADVPAFAALPPADRERLRALLAGFSVAEAAVAAHLGPFADAAEDPDLARAFALQAVDEARHARFFARAAAVFGAPRSLARPELVALFEDELPRRAGDLAAGGDLRHAVGLYHLVLEGIAFLVGQRALLDAAAPLPVLSDGVRRVQADERWHLGLGVLCLARSGAGELDLDGPARLALRCWGDVGADAEWVLSGHWRRLRLGGADQRSLDAVADLGDVLVEGLDRPAAGVHGG
jgi:ribonucleoside-diphosphate reductase beta chain